MTIRWLPVNSEETVALLGLFLILMVARLTIHGGFLARRAIDAIAIIGWIVDHLPPAAIWRTR